MLEAMGAARPYGLMFDAVPPQPISVAAHVIKVLRAIGEYVLLPPCALEYFK